MSTKPITFVSFASCLGLTLLLVAHDAKGDAETCRRQQQMLLSRCDSMPSATGGDAAGRARLNETARRICRDAANRALSTCLASQPTSSPTRSPVPKREPRRERARERDRVDDDEVDDDDDYADRRERRREARPPESTPSPRVSGAKKEISPQARAGIRSSPKPKAGADATEEKGTPVCKSADFRSLVGEEEFAALCADPFTDKVPITEPPKKPEDLKSDPCAGIHFFETTSTEESGIAATLPAEGIRIGYRLKRPRTQIARGQETCQLWNLASIQLYVENTSGQKKAVEFSWTWSASTLDPKPNTTILRDVGLGMSCHAIKGQTTSTCSNLFVQPDVLITSSTVQLDIRNLRATTIP